MHDESISQAEIDALVRGIMGGEEVAPAAAVEEKGADDMSLLREPLRTYVESAGKALGDLVGAPCAATLAEATTMPLSGAAGLLSGQILGGKVELTSGMSGYIIYLVPSFLGLAMITQLYGGVAPSYMDDSALGALAEGLSQMTQAGLVRLGEVLARPVTASQVDARSITDATEFGVVAPRAPVIAASLDLTVSETSGRMYLLFQQESLNPVVQAMRVKAQARSKPAGEVLPPPVAHAAAAAAAIAPAAPPAPARPAPAPMPLAQPVPYQTAQFPDLAPRNRPEEIRNIDLLMDVSLQVTVELGRTRRQIRDVLALGPGSVVELDKLAGEQVDVLVNGKLIAKGEVVVIDENYGVRITDIISPQDRVQSLK